MQTYNDVTGYIIYPMNAILGVTYMVLAIYF